VPRARLLIDFLRRGRSFSYGEHRSQTAELFLPPGAGPHPVVVTIHGGSWQKRYGKAVMRSLAADLVRRGRAVWNIEYRRLGEGGGWPATFADVASAIDRLAGVRAPLDLEDLTVLGHSAGGQLALWAAGRARLPAGVVGSVPVLSPRRAVSQAGVCDLRGAYRLWRGGAVRALMGGSPEEFPERFALADPVARVPLELPVLLVHGVEDTIVSVALSRSYRDAARAAGGTVELVELPGEAGLHRAHIDPRGAAWAPVARWLAR
jgi:acetyl esterase/lipase